MRVCDTCGDMGRDLFDSDVCTSCGDDLCDACAETGKNDGRVCQSCAEDESNEDFDEEGEE